MDILFWAAAPINDIWYALPLLAAVSLVYSTTRGERTLPIPGQALRFAVKVGGVLLVLMLVLLLMSR